MIFLVCIVLILLENKLKSHENVRKNKDFCGILMPSEKDKILEFKQYMKSHRMPYIIYADICYYMLFILLRKIDRCANNPEKSSTKKIGEHIPCGYSMSAILGFDHIENKHALYHGKGCTKTFCDSLGNTEKIQLLLKRKKCRH